MLSFIEIVEDNIWFAGLSCCFVVLGGMDIKVNTILYPYYFFDGVRSAAAEKAGNIQKEFVREMSQAIYVKPGSMDEAYISFKKGS